MCKETPRQQLPLILGPVPYQVGDLPCVLKSTSRAKVKMVVIAEPSPMFPHLMRNHLWIFLLSLAMTHLAR